MAAQGDFEDVRVHDFLIKELGPAVPRGVYDLAANEGFVGVGSTTIRRLSLVQTLRRWWTEVGSISTTTETGPKVLCELDPNPYPKGLAVTDDQMASLNLARADFHGEWNYTIKPRPTAMNL